MIDGTIKFHELIQGANYTYSAYVMNNNPNYAEECEAAGLSKASLLNDNDRFTLSSVNGIPAGTYRHSCQHLPETELRSPSQTV